MNFQLFDENTWLYPDTVLESSQKSSLPVFLARGGHAGLQLLTDCVLAQPEPVQLSAVLPQGVSVQWYQLLPTLVEANSDAHTGTTQKYEEVADFVTRKAPFLVYDITEELTQPVLKPGRTALFVRFYAEEEVQPGSFEATLTVTLQQETLRVQLPFTVTNAKVPALSQTTFGVINWLNLPELAENHRVEENSPEFWDVTDRYLDHQRELRCNHLVLPGGVPVYNEQGELQSFDFAQCEELGKRALKKGFAFIYGGFVARFEVWNEPEQYLLWDRTVSVTSLEGYRQLKLYFTALWNMVQKNGWEHCWMQCLVDEPQFPNSLSYRALSAICRKFMPGVTIHDPVESTDVEGAMDIWCVKQAVFQKYRETFKKLQEIGESLWVYTCGFPTGKWMNRATDLPLLAGRLPFWMCAAENFDGFLHWGYNVYHHSDPVLHNCYTEDGKATMPPGNGFIVYPGKEGPVSSLRAQLQLFGAEDCELLRQLPAEKCQRLVGSLCKSFEEYVSDPAVFAKVRKELLLSFEG